MENNMVTIENKIELLIKDMGKSTFLKLVHFVVEVMEEDSAIKILMVRRFLDIFLEFEEIVKYMYGDTVVKRGRFVTNLSAGALRERLANQKILVVDDIRLHGRALDEISSFLVEQCHCPEENIVFKIFADNIEADKVECRFNHKIEVRESINENRWRKVSSSIINSFYILGQPYVSHLPYCELMFGTDGADIIYNFLQNSKVEEITTEIQRYYGVRRYLYFMDAADDKELITQMAFVEQNMIRIYVYERLKKIVIVPYAFLKPLSFEGIMSCYNFLCDLEIVQKTIVSKIVCDAGKVENIDYLAKYLYGLTTYIVSVAIGQKFLTGKEIQNAIWRKEIEKYNFGCRVDLKDTEIDLFFKELSAIVKGKYIEFGDANLQLSKEVEVENIVTQIQSSNIEKPSVYRFMESYMKLNGKRDEELSQQTNQRIRGIEYLRLRKYLVGVELKDVWKSIINIVDSGRGTLTMSCNMINQKSYFDAFLYAGEQNFACNEPNLIYLIYPLLECECLYHNDLKLRDKSKKDLMNAKSGLISFIFKKFPELRNEVNDYEIENLKEKSLIKGGIDYYLSRFPVYEKDEKLKQILEITRHCMEGKIHG